MNLIYDCLNLHMWKWTPLIDRDGFTLHWGALNFGETEFEPKIELHDHLSCQAHGWETILGCRNDLMLSLWCRPVLMVSVLQLKSSLCDQTKCKTTTGGQSWSEISSSQYWLEVPACFYSGSYFLNVELSSKYNLCSGSGSHFSIVHGEGRFFVISQPWPDGCSLPSKHSFLSWDEYYTIRNQYFLLLLSCVL